MKKRIIFLGILILVLAGGLVAFFLLSPKNKIQEFIYTNPLKITFKDADKYLSKSFTASESEAYNFLNSEESDLNKGNATFHYSILKDKKNEEFSYAMYFQNMASCEYFADIIKDAYKKDFIYHLDGEGGFKAMTGSIDIKNWRIEAICTSDKNSVNLAVLRSGSKDQINKVTKRQKIECEYTQYNGGSVVYQIDDEKKLLLGSNGFTMGDVIQFDDDFIIVKRDKDLEIKIDRKAAKFEARSIKNRLAVLSGTCKKRTSEKKF